MTINQFLNWMKPVDDMDYKICLVDFMIGSMETYVFDHLGETGWKEFTHSVPGGFRDVKSVRLSTTNNDDIVLSLVLSQKRKTPARNVQVFVAIISFLLCTVGRQAFPYWRDNRIQSMCRSQDSVYR